MSSDHTSNLPGIESSSIVRAAPASDRPEADGTRWSRTENTDLASDAVSVLGFYPFDSLEEAAALSWLQFIEGVDVVVATDANPQRLGRVAPPLRSLPLLCDPEGEVAADYGVDYGNVATRRVVLVDASRKVVRTWPADHDPRDVHAAALEQVETGESPRQGGVK